MEKQNQCQEKELQVEFSGWLAELGSHKAPELEDRKVGWLLVHGGGIEERQ